VQAPFTLSTDVVRIWSIRTSVSAYIAGRLARNLSVDEFARADRFGFPHLRTTFIAARGALRLILGRCLHVPAADLHFAYMSAGKPFLPARPSVQFNVSHSGDLALIAMASGSAIGVDVEQIRVFPHMEQVARQSFRAQDFAKWVQLPVGAREQEFYRMWTRREAYGKATGEGLAAGACVPSNLWSFQDLEAGSGYAAAAAYNDKPRRVIFHALSDMAELLTSSVY
jgi:4'-phosphopantetheinyl transferase